MSVRVYVHIGGVAVDLRASGGYSPDVVDDLTARAASLLRDAVTAAAVGEPVGQEAGEAQWTS